MRFGFLLVTYYHKGNMTTGYTGDKSADFLIRQLRLLRRIGDREHKRDAARWEEIVRRHAIPEQEPQAVNFATAVAPEKKEGA